MDPAVRATAAMMRRRSGDLQLFEGEEKMHLPAEEPTRPAKLLTRLTYGGERLERKTDGYYLLPALFTEATNAMRISREEIFGPVACVLRATHYDEALAIANDTDFGLSAGIATTSLKHASHFKRYAQYGMVMVNLPTAGVDYHVPFGGRKASSYGPREQGRYAVELYTTGKTAYVAS
jgi:alpha-ketoglutaric semialdehyde dehydrogenase